MSIELPAVDTATRGQDRHEKRLWTVTDLATYLGVPINTIYKWRTAGQGPPALKIGRHLRYDRNAVAEWLEKQKTT